MPTTFPTSLDALTNPSGSDQMTSHAAQHVSANDAIEALEAKVGVDGSAVVTSLDYKISLLASPDFTAENKDTATISAGMAVAIHGSGVGLLRADATETSIEAVGLAVAGILQTVSGAVRTSSALTLSDWTAATGSPTLAARAVYFLDIVAGKLTTTAPVMPGNIVQRVGYALSPNTMLIEVGLLLLL